MPQLGGQTRRAAEPEPVFRPFDAPECDTPLIWEEGKPAVQFAQNQKPHREGLQQPSNKPPHWACQRGAVTRRFDLDDFGTKACEWIVGGSRALGYQLQVVV